MDINDFSFHEAEILEVKEHSEQVIDFLINFPVDWEKNVFEKRILRFNDVTSYQINEIPFFGRPVILEIISLGKDVKIIGSGKNQIEVMRNKIEIHTNAGDRIIEYAKCELMVWG